MTDKIRSFLRKIPSKFNPIAQIAESYLKYSSKIESDQSIKIAHNPAEFPEHYGISLYPAAEKSYFKQYLKNFDREIPSIYKEFLQAINGAFILEMQLFGLTPSLYRHGLLDRTILQCLDVGSANSEWKHEYENISESEFHFGGRGWTETENLGYFLNTDGRIFVKRKNGLILAQYENFSDFLRPEIEASEKLYLSGPRKKSFKLP